MCYGFIFQSGYLKAKHLRERRDVYISRGHCAKGLENKEKKVRDDGTL